MIPLTDAGRRAALCALALSLSAVQGADARTGRLRVLYTFGGKPDGANAQGALLADKAGNLYGTTAAGGSRNDGAVFRIAPGGKETVLYSFCGAADCADGENPVAGLIADRAGNLLGTTMWGGAGCLDGYCGEGTIFRLAPDGTQTVLYSFCSQTDCADGANPTASVIADAEGNLYGTTNAGGAQDAGAVFELAADGSESVLHSFGSGNDGDYPKAPLVADGAGNLYGTTEYGGSGADPSFSMGGGTVFTLSRSGNAWTETVLYDFCTRSDCADGEWPVASLVENHAGDLYGTTLAGGAGVGVVFEIAAAGGETVLHSFAGGSDGDNPFAGLVASGGAYYGTTLLGGRNDGGTAFKLSLSHGAWRETPLHSFSAGKDGAQPWGDLIAGKSGILYGTTSSGSGRERDGAVFEIHR